MTPTPVPSGASPGEGQPPAEDALGMLARMRRGTRYQPAPGAPDAAADDDDPNGCLPKLRLLLDTGFDLAGSSMLSLGASSALYELEMARAAAGRACEPGAPQAVHLVDLDADALKVAADGFAELHVPDFRAVRATADGFAFERAYDVCFFLSLYHHYDRLGGDYRTRGARVLREIGRHCQTLFFETGQTDDTVPGSERWPAMLEMAAHESPAAWLEARIPEMTGYDSFARLGTNPRTRRHLYAFWRARPVDAAPAFAAGVFPAARPAGTAGETAVVAVDREPGGGLAWSAPAGGSSAPLGEGVDAVKGRSAFIDCRFTGADVPAEERSAGIGEVVAALAGVDPRSYVLLLGHTGALRDVPDGVNAAYRVRCGDEADVPGRLRTAAFSGFGMACVDERLRTPAVRELAAGLGLRLVFASDGGIRT
ncbi:MAG: hypothetical protein JWM27_4587 [Gemmatimonadetes bacterium]|nr:hypothetical protein [Gemmatimonadota bacterium]